MPKHASETVTMSAHLWPRATRQCTPCGSCCATWTRCAYLLLYWHRKRVYGQMSSACRSELYEVATSCSDTESNVCTTAQQTLEKCVAPFDKQLRSAARGF